MASALKDLSDALAGVVETVGRSTVRVDARDRLPATGVVWSDDGVIVTADHVVERDEQIEVGLPDGGTATATVAGRDSTTDLAVLRADARGLQAAQWAEISNVKVGHLVLAIARPRRSLMTTLGVISGLGGGWRTPAGGQVDRFVQTDIEMYPGFSGGPLGDAEGRLIGINTSGLLRGISVALPASTLRQVVDALLSHGRVRRGYLGIGAQPVRLPEPIAQQAGQETGLLLVSVEPGGPAEKAGLLLGDTIIGIAGQTVRHLDDLQAALTGDLVGQSTPVRVLRAGQVQEVQAVIGERQ